MSRLSVLGITGAVSLQDGGRSGYQRYGLSASGPMDRLAMATANALVGNPPDAAAIEFGLGGGRFRAEGGGATFALAGAPCTLRLDGSLLVGHRCFTVSDGSEVAIAPPRQGAFVYLAVAGGFTGTPQLGSLSLHQRAKLGGIDGRSVEAGDVLPWMPAPPLVRGDVAIEPVAMEGDAAIRVMLGPQADHFTEAGLAVFLGASFTVTHRADRMGYQLDGPAIAHGPGGFNIVSDATAAGSVQVPGNGMPIVLMADRQTTGGYPKIATVISADLRRIAQRRPGDIVRFEAVDLETALFVAKRRADDIAGLNGRLRGVAAMDAERLMGANLAGQAVDAFGDSG